MSKEKPYEGREQTLIKHFILRHYLERFVHIIGSRWNTVTYVDCFSGPWKNASEQFEDTSFSIALQELRKARETHKGRGKSLQLRCMFIERDPEAYAKLKEFADTVTDVTVETKNSALSGSIGEVLDFVKRGGPASFPFFFIDPTGWTGFEMDLIAPLLRQQPGEVLINFMTDYIRRFIDHPSQQTREQFAALFGAADVKDRIQSLDGAEDREDALFRAYGENVRATGVFSHVCAAIILHPLIDRTYFHLIYATRDRKGVEVFKEAEEKAMQVQQQARAAVKQRKRTTKTKQPELFSAQEMDQTRSIDRLRERYLHQALESVRALLEGETPVLYEAAWDLALSFPLVWEGDLKDWIRDWHRDGCLRIEGMGPREKVPKRDKSHSLVWQGPQR